MLRPRQLFIIGLVLLAAAAWVVRAERVTHTTTVWRASDVARLDQLLQSTRDLRDEILATRAGISHNFDNLNAAARNLRQVENLANHIRRRGSEFAPVAGTLTRSAESLRHELIVLERFKSNLTLLQLASGFVANAHEHAWQELLALLQALRSEQANGRRTVSTTDALANFEQTLTVIGHLQAQVGRYQQAPSQETRTALHSAIEAATAVGSGLPLGLQQELGVLLGHTRAILERRERVDELTRPLLQTPWRAELEAAREAYQLTAERNAQQVLILRITAAELGGIGLLALIGCSGLLLRRQWPVF